ncbi:MAG: hypothetical protein IH994_09050 [Proteobacteria bacterium]|nr:hypothetical protein [Pseudomonadota bacterium]
MSAFFYAVEVTQLEKQNKAIDLVYVSHIDRDHVYGILQMMEDLVDWRVYDFHQNAPGGNRRLPRPKVLRPPEIKGIWHNVFHELAGRNAGPIGDMLASCARTVSGFTSAELADLSTDDLDMTKTADTFRNLTSSIGDAIELSRRVNARQLGIPVNNEFGNKLILLKDDQKPVKLGSMKIHVIGPSKSDINKLRRKWNKWLKSETGARQVRKIRRNHRPDEEILDTGEFGDLLATRRSDASKLGRRARVTLPNLASLMLLVEENGKTVLLTGDGHWEDILKGLEHIGKLVPGGGFHVEVLKIQHHGSEHNLNLSFCQRLTADNYVFCGNGAHENPDLRVINAIAKSRIGTASERSANLEGANQCTFWFNSSSTYSHGKAKNRAHMKKIEKKMKSLKRKSDGKIRYRFLKSDKFEIEV